MSILLDETTPVMVQGATGKQAAIHIPYMREYGTRIVCGVSPGKGGTFIDGVPIYSSVKDACSEHEVTWSVLFIGAKNVKAAALEAIEAGVRGLVILEDGVPFRDTAEIVSAARATGTRIIGPSSQGLISPGRAKIGGTGGSDPGRVFQPGPVGILSRSGGMGVEIALLLSHHGIGQSTYVAVGGDLITGSGFADFLVEFQRDPQTRVIVLFGEPGTEQEERAAEAIEAGLITKPVVAFLAGRSLANLPPGLTFGHTAALMGGGAGSVSAKATVLEKAGAEVVSNLGELLSVVADALGKSTDAERQNGQIP